MVTDRKGLLIAPLWGLWLAPGLRIRWRKPWGGPLVIHWRTCQGQGKIALLDPSHQVIWTQGRRPIHSGLTPMPLPLLEILDLSRGRGLNRLRTYVQIQRAQASLQIGLPDPARTAWLWGLCASLPPQWPLQLQVSFTENGWRSRGELDLRWQRWAVAWALIEIWIGHWWVRGVKERRR